MIWKSQKPGYILVLRPNFNILKGSAFLYHFSPLGNFRINSADVIHNWEPTIRVRNASNWNN